VFLTISGLNKEGEIRMKRLLLAIIALSALCAKAEESAQTAQPTETATASPVEFYVGVSVGHDRMTAKRTEQVVTGTFNTFLSFSNNKTQRANAVNGKVIAGFLWTIPNTQFVLSPEVYIGQGSAQVTLQESKFDNAPAPAAEKSYQSTFKQGLTIGAVLRAGFYLTDDNNLFYGLVGMGRSKFENKFTFTSGNVGGPIPTLFEKRSKFLGSTIFGGGFERKFNTFKVGLDCRYASYSAWGNYSKTALVSEDTLSIRFKPKIVSTSLTFCYLF
jgi:opacity protein-like surface antigen